MQHKVVGICTQTLDPAKPKAKHVVLLGVQHADAGAAAADSQVAAASASLAYGVWINFAKNPRLKQIEFPEIGAVIELPKSLALANIAVRLLQAPASSALRARNGYMPVGGVWQVWSLGWRREGVCVGCGGEGGGGGDCIRGSKNLHPLECMLKIYN